MEFLIKGQFKKGDSFQKFSKKVSADTKTLAIHKAYSILGSNYKCKRNLIKIESVEEVK